MTVTIEKSIVPGLSPSDGEGEEGADAESPTDDQDTIIQKMKKPDAIETTSTAADAGTVSPFSSGRSVQGDAAEGIEASLAELDSFQRRQRSVDSTFVFLTDQSELLEFDASEHEIGVDMLRSLELQALERLLQQEIYESVSWTAWDEDSYYGDSPVAVYVGTVGAAAGLFSVGYVMWAIRGGAFIAALSTSLPSWRLIDPSSLLGAYQSSRAIANDRVEKLMN